MLARQKRFGWVGVQAVVRFTLGGKQRPVGADDLLEHGDLEPPP